MREGEVKPQAMRDFHSAGRLQGELCRLMDQGADTPLTSMLAPVRRIEIERAEIGPASAIRVGNARRWPVEQ